VTKELTSKQDKQENLKQVLRETMNLTMTLKGQLAILEKRGIHNKPDFFKIAC
jgi:hypothetical protein